MTDVCVARQPIFGTAGDVAGYELLSCHSATDARARRFGHGVATAEVVTAVLGLGLEQLTAGRAAYVGITPEMLIQGTYSVLPRDGVVIELPENVEPDDQIEFACEQLVNAGYVLALDASSGWDSPRLLELASVVKVDVRDQPPFRLDAIAQELAVYDIRLLADCVHTAQERALCAGLGYELFQGSYYARPAVVRSRALGSEEVAIIRALNVLRDAQASEADAEAIFATDVGLASKLLRMVNAAAHDSDIASIRDALQIQGRDALGTWLALLLTSSIAARDSATRELLHLAVQRARLCELMVGPSGRACDAHAMFLVGLFSLLDAIAGMPMDALLEPLALPAPLRDALLERTGPYAISLVMAEAWERGDWTTVRRYASVAGIEPPEISPLYVQSLVWTRDRLRSLNAA
jgi:EAL and modified HD-GYP domain-containing signal transduction protein